MQLGCKWCHRLRLTSISGFSALLGSKNMVNHAFPAIACNRNFNISNPQTLLNPFKTHRYHDGAIIFLSHHLLCKIKSSGPPRPGHILRGFILYRAPTAFIPNDNTRHFTGAGCWKGLPTSGSAVYKGRPPRNSTFKKWFFHFACAIEGSFDYSMDDGSGRTSSRLGLLRRRCFVERRLERMVCAVLDAALCMPSDISIWRWGHGNEQIA